MKSLYLASIILLGEKSSGMVMNTINIIIPEVSNKLISGHRGYFG